MTSTAVYFPTGDPLWGRLDLDAFGWALGLASWTPLVGVDVNLDDITANEPTDGSYSRVGLTGGVITPDLFNEWTTYDADDPTFPALAGAEALGWVVLYRDTGLLTTSTLLVAMRIARLTDGSDVTIGLSSTGIIRRSHAVALVVE